SAFITGLSVLLVPLLGFALFGQRPRPRTLAGVILATAGLGLLTLERLELRLNLGDALTLVCALLFALHILYIGRYTGATDYRQLVLPQVGLTAAVIGAAPPLLEPLFVIWDVRLVVYVLAAGGLSTALAFYVQNWAQRFTTPNRTALIFTLEPI